MARVFSVHARASGGADAAVDLHDAALEDAVLGPRAREVLHARHLDPRHVAGRGEAADPVAMGVAGEVARGCAAGGPRARSGARSRPG